MDDQLSKAHSTQQVLYMVLSQFVKTKSGYNSSN